MDMYYSESGVRVSLDEKLGTGGEGAVYAVTGHANRVAKIYHKPPTKEKAEKLRVMSALGSASPELIQSAAWPLDTLHKIAGGPLAGVVMPRVTGHKEIHTLYSPAHRKLIFPKSDWAFLIQVGMNCAAAFDAIHRKSHVIGDVNQGNVLVSDRGTVFLIDCDSFQIANNGQVFLCEVGVPQYTPPELQGRSFRGIRRTVNHDRFGLAVLIFHLLFMGRHPFAGRYLGRGEMPLEQAIREFRFVFGSNPQSLQMDSPPHALNVPHVAPSLVRLFERAFVSGSQVEQSRPDAREWYAALQTVAAQLRPCQANRGHKFPSRLSNCPWCEVIQQGGPDFFISITFDFATAATFRLICNVDELWMPIDQVRRPATAMVSVAWKGHPPRGTPVRPGIEENRQLAKLVGGVTVASIIGLLLSGFLPKAAYFMAPTLIIFGSWWAFLRLTSRYAAERRRRKHNFSSQRQRLVRIRDEWKQIASQYEQQFSAVRSQLELVREQYGALPRQFDAESQRLEADKAQRQMELFLDQHFIADEYIEQIGPGRQAILASYQIETALDIDVTKILKIPGFGPSLTGVLLEWRRKIESQFRFDPKQSVSMAERQRLIMKYTQLRQQLETMLRRGPVELAGIVTTAHNALESLHVQLLAAERSVAQAEADVKVMA